MDGLPPPSSAKQVVNVFEVAMKLHREVHRGNSKLLWHGLRVPMFCNINWYRYKSRRTLALRLESAHAV
jgi:hypothetical protein